MGATPCLAIERILLHLEPIELDAVADGRLELRDQILRHVEVLEKAEIPDRGGKVGETVSLEVERFEGLELPDIIRQLEQLVRAHREPLQVAQEADVIVEGLETVVVERDRLEIVQLAHGRELDQGVLVESELLEGRQPAERAAEALELRRLPLALGRVGKCRVGWRDHRVQIERAQRGRVHAVHDGACAFGAERHVVEERELRQDRVFRDELPD